MGETQRRQNGVQLRQQLQSVFVAGLEGSEAICSKGPPGEKTRKLSALFCYNPCMTLHLPITLHHIPTAHMGTDVVVLLGRHLQR